MRMSVTCEGCGKRHEVDGAHAGRRGKCSRCGRVMIIPDVPQAAPPPPEGQEPEVYAVEDRPEAAPSTFVPALGRSDTISSSSRSRAKRTPKPSVRTQAGEALGPLAAALRRAIPIVLVTIVVLVALAALLPRGMLIVGMVVTIAGLLLTLYGYATGVYIAFTEDSLHGLLFLMIPFYAAYYLFSRWEEMRSRLFLVLAGLALLTIGGWTLEAGLTRAGLEPPAQDGQARIGPRAVELV